MRHLQHPPALLGASLWLSCRACHGIPMQYGKEIPAFAGMTSKRLDRHGASAPRNDATEWFTVNT
jgi:hypothetical protein